MAYLRRNKRYRNSDDNKATKQSLLSQFLLRLFSCEDLVKRDLKGINVTLIYFGHLIRQSDLTDYIVRPLLELKELEFNEIANRAGFEEENNLDDVVSKILEGYVVICYDNRLFTIDLYGPEHRSIEESETESVVVGARDAFVESSNINLSLIRRRIRNPDLKVIKLQINNLVNTPVYLVYIQNCADKEIVKELQKRIGKIEVKSVPETNAIVQQLDDHPLSLFPQFFTTERPDVIISKLLEGKVIGIVDGSPSLFSAPTNIYEFFQSADDYGQRWLAGSFLRLLRLLAFVITISATALYIAISTYHYEMLPVPLLETLEQSRARVPFPPFYEALLMELLIEFLREAAGRLPTKIGQTIGIVGGIVIGQAAVDAGFASNIIIIVVATSAITSFMFANYVMSSSIRILRFLFIFLAALWGNYGIIIGIGIVIIHLSGLKTLQSPYLFPIAPLDIKRWMDSIIRGPFKNLKDKPTKILNSKNQP